MERRTRLSRMSARRRQELAEQGNRNPFSTITNAALTPSQPAAGKVKPRSTDTGPNRGTVATVVARDFGRCARCGDPVSGERGRDWSVQHRRARAMGGTSRSDANEPQNLILLCGSATTSCHLHVESHREEARANGWAIRLSDDPAEVPVNHAVHGWVLLNDVGTFTTYSPNHDHTHA
ncbi:HNH endonuclease [Micromonospora sp. NPDC048935]|uniref:HNH endonuclease n=1 Tax=Micromonospora sp. NPDC048935 TaxID=3364262 RepID=UPI0037137EF3